GETIYTNSYSTSMYKVASRTYALGDAEDNETYKTLALNYFTSASVKDAKAFVTDGVIVFNGATQPAFSQNAIVIKDNSVLTSGVQYLISQEGVITISNATTNEGKTVSYYVVDNGVLTVVNAEFVDVSITGIEVNALSSEYKRTDDVANNLTFKFTYDNGTVSESYTLNEGNIYSIEIEGNVATVVVKVTVNNVVYSDEVTLTVSEEPSSVAEVLSATVGGEYMLNGVVVGFATTIDQNEVILADNNGNFISVAGLGGGKLVNGSYYVDGIDVGYEITIPVVLKNDGVGANANKLYASYAGGSNTAISVVSKNNAVSMPSEKLLIDSTEDLTALFTGNNQYKLVTLKGEMNFVMDNDFELYDFWFFDSVASNIDEIAVNGLIPTFSNVSTIITTNKTFGEIALGNKNANSLDFNKPHNVIKEITALYLGGNETHAQFVLLSDNSVEDATPTLTT
ncbi:MAG: hypothetical protein IKA54_04730, partial [Clostridia bacterium]|nr:hypothetical protein [Clostridia bacterium]